MEIAQESMSPRMEKKKALACRVVDSMDWKHFRALAEMEISDWITKAANTGKESSLRNAEALKHFMEMTIHLGNKKTNPKYEFTFGEE